MLVRPSEQMREVTFSVADPDAARRLDVMIAATVAGASRAAVQRWIRDGLVTVNGRPAKPSLLLTPGDAIHVRLPEPEPSTLEAEDLPLQVPHADASIVVVDKPAGMVVHPAAGHKGGTLVNALLHHIKGLSSAGGQARPGIVHRLDKGTSGLMVIARTDEAHRNLGRQFHDRQVSKIYVALVWGRPKPGQVFDAPLGRDPRHRQKMSSRAHRGRSALTTVLSVAPMGEVSLLRLQIGTGRTHQIRVHLSEAGFPVVGDELYGGVRSRVPARLAAVSRLTRPFLHAAHLEFAHPEDATPMAFDSPLPADLSMLLAAIGDTAVPHSPQEAS